MILSIKISAKLITIGYQLSIRRRMALLSGFDNQVCGFDATGAGRAFCRILFICLYLHQLTNQ